MTPLGTRRVVIHKESLSTEPIVRPILIDSYCDLNVSSNSYNLMLLLVNFFLFVITCKDRAQSQANQGSFSYNTSIPVWFIDTG